MHLALVNRLGALSLPMYSVDVDAKQQQEINGKATLLNNITQCGTTQKLICQQFEQQSHAHTTKLVSGSSDILFTLGSPE